MVQGFEEYGALGNGEWALGIKEAAVSDARFNTILSMPDDGRCFSDAETLREQRREPPFG